MSKEYPTYETEGGQPNPERRRGRPGIIFPILLIGVGVVALLSNLGVADVNWQVLVRFWPVLLILLGLDVIFGRHSFLGSVIVGLAALITVAGLLWVSSAPARLEVIGIKEPKWGQAVSGNIEEPLGNVSRLEVDVDLSASELVIGAQSGREYAVQGDYSTDSVLQPSVYYDTHGDTGELTITQSGDNWLFPWDWNVQNRVTVNLPADIPIDLRVKGDLGGQSLDLTGLDVRYLEVENSSGPVTVVLPQSAELSSVNISADLGSITVSVPNGAAINVDDLDISNGSGAVTLNLPSLGSLEHVNIKADLGAITITVPDNASLDMRSLYVENGSGAVKLALPAGGSLGDVVVKADLGEIVISIPGGPNGLRTDSLVVENGSGAITVNLPDEGDYDATIRADLGGITVIVPDGLEARAEIVTDLGSKNVSNPRFREVDDDTWETDGYDSGSNRVLLDIVSSSGGVTIR
ncbi:MAG: DUF4097 family beta strand repeat protein [Anaerolineae bacterium]|nr:DUF4097 family beta strand repeat protein [Anaerolineae bacterium]